MPVSQWFILAGQQREADFLYNDKKYSISINSRGRWFLTRYGEPENAQEFSSFFEIIDNALVDNIPFKEVCGRFEVEAVY